MCAGVDGPSRRYREPVDEPRPCCQSAEDRYISDCISRDLGASEEEIENMRYKEES